TSLSGQIVFDNFQDVWSINADGTGLTRLTRSPDPEFQPTLSPDGRLIAYRREPNGQPEIWVMNADGSAQHRLTRDGGFPAWSPHQRQVASRSCGQLQGHLCPASWRGGREAPDARWRGNASLLSG